MKNIIISLIAFFSFGILGFAQSFDKCYEKQINNYSYYRVIVGDTVTYYKVPQNQLMKFWNDFEKQKAQTSIHVIWEKSYTNKDISEIEVTKDDIQKLMSVEYGDQENVRMSSHSNYEVSQSRQSFNDIILDKDEVLAKKLKGIEVSTSSFHEYGKNYQIFEIVNAGNKSLIGDKIVCKIVEKRKSNISGSEGRLTIRPLYIEDEDLGRIRLLPTDIYLRGLNRTNVKRWLSPIAFPFFFIAGSRAELLSNKGYVFTIK